MAPSPGAVERIPPLEVPQLFHSSSRREAGGPDVGRRAGQNKGPPGQSVPHS